MLTPLISPAFTSPPIFLFCLCILHLLLFTAPANMCLSIVFLSRLPLPTLLVLWDFLEELTLLLFLHLRPRYSRQYLCLCSFIQPAPPTGNTPCNSSEPLEHPSPKYYIITIVLHQKGEQFPPKYSYQHFALI